MKKRLLAVLLTLAMCLALMPTAALAADSGLDIKNGILYEYNGPGGDVTIPGNVTTIMAGAFQDCAGLTSVTIPSSVTRIGPDLFSGCPNLTAIQVDPGNPILASVDGVMFSKDLVYLLAYPNGKQGAYTIPSGVKRIEEFAFSYSTGLTGVTIPDSMLEIGFGAFQVCPNLKGSVTIPDSVQLIDVDVFNGSTGLTSIQVGTGNPNYTSVDGVLFSKDLKTLLSYPNGKQGAYTVPDGVTDIAAFSFAHSAGIPSVTIPASVRSIGQYAFNFVNSLRDVYYAGTQAQWNAISIRENNEALDFAAIHCKGDGTTMSAPSVDPADVYASILAMKSSYPEGMSWTNDNSYQWKGSNITGFGCAGFAYLLSDAAFGDFPARKLTSFSYDDVRVGDILRINHDTHSVVVLETHENHVVIAEGNYNRSIHWGRTLSKQEVMNADYLWSRYPLTPVQPAAETANPTNDKLRVDGAAAAPAAYKIGGANYFKLRDVAMLLKGSMAQFSTEYDGEKNAVMITTGQPYQPIGGELGTVPTAAATATASNDAVYINGVKADLTAYKIDGANYYGLRELGKALGFNVGWTQENGMFIESDKPYTDAN